jgi:hypothetical protein
MVCGRRLKLQRVPDHSTLQKFSQRAVHPEGIDRWLAQLLERVQPAAETVAMDATGWESTPSSAYYQTRRGQRRKDDVPVSRLIVCGKLFPCRVLIAQWPCNDEIATRNRHVHVLGQVHRVRCNDASTSRNLQAKVLAQVFPQQFVANASYGAECVHEFCRERWRVSSWIPLAVHSRDGRVQSPPAAPAN